MHPGFIHPPGLLPVPIRISPTPELAAGLRCVWCGDIAGVDLGPRLRITDESLHRWKPRACAPCVRSQAEKAHCVHRNTCARCTEWEHCPDSRALQRLAIGRLDGLIREG